jgi:dienelactone hydrolase
MTWFRLPPAALVFWLLSVSPTLPDPRLLPVGVPHPTLEQGLQAFQAFPSGHGTASDPVPAIVFLHGCSGLQREGEVFGIYQAWADILLGEGYAVLTIDSAASRGFQSTCGQRPERKVMYRERPGDAYAGLGYLQSLPGIDPARIFLMGWSQGGGIALRTMGTQSVGRPDPAPDPDFRGAIALYPAAWSSRLQVQPYTSVAPGTWQTVAPLLVLQGADDNWTLPAPCIAFVDEARRRGEPVEIIVYRDAVHAFDAPKLPLQAREDVRTVRGEAPLVGTNDEAREAAILAVQAFLDRLR